MSSINMFEDLPEGFRLATSDPVDVSLVSLTYAQAFAEYPYPIPSTDIDPSVRLKFWYADALERVNNTLEHGYVLTNEDYSAIMLIVPYKDAAVTDVDEMANFFRENATEADVENYLALEENIVEAEAEMPWLEDTVYIEILAVQPPRQGKKEASRLMRKLFEECEKIDQDVSLITHTERNESIYQHFGFDTVEKRVDEEHNSICYYMLKKIK